VLLYELLTGTTPFEPEELRSRAFLEIMRIVREDDPPTPSARLNTLGNRLTEVADRRHAEPHTLTKLVRGDLDWMVMKALEKDRRRRYDSAADFANDVSRYFRHEPVNARRPSAAYRMQKFARRRRGPLLAAAGIGVAVMAGGALAQLQDRDSSAGPALPVIEPQLTRIFGSDTLQIHRPALSPDGRWVAFSTMTAGETYGPLLIVSSDGGEPERLTEEQATEATWFPQGDRIAYISEGGIIATLPFDSRTGRPTGPPRKLVSDRVSGFRLSPNGGSIAYHVWPDSTGMAIRVISATGGESRTAVVGSGRLFLMDWSADGRQLYYRAETSEGSRMFRVATEGGQPELLESVPNDASAPRTPYQVVRISEQPAAGLPLEVQTYDGSPIARLALPQGASTDQVGRTFAAGGRYLLTVVDGDASVVRTVSVGGGSPRQIGEGRPLAWSADGSDVFFVTPMQARNVIMRASLTSGTARAVGPMPDRGPPVFSAWMHPVTFSGDLRDLSYSRPTPNTTDRTLVVRPSSGGKERVVTRSLFQHSAFHLAGPGGTPNVAGNDFLYLERFGAEVQLRATHADGPPRVLRSFPIEEARVPMGVFGDRVAYASKPGAGLIQSFDTTEIPRILVANDAHDAVKEIAVPPGVRAFDDIVWSHDGRWIAATAYVGTGRRDYVLKVLVVGVTSNGDVFAAARLIDTPIIYSAWGLQWLPDRSAVTLTGQSPPDGKFNVWLIPLTGDRSPVALTASEKSRIDFNIQAPDGRKVVYRASVAGGTSLWLADLGDALTKSGAR
jgi:Tol biopolymer transport system component